MGSWTELSPCCLQWVWLSSLLKMDTATTSEHVPLTLALITHFSWFAVVSMHKLQSIVLHQNCICINNTDTLACMCKTKWNKHKKLRYVRLYKPGVRNKNNTLLWLAAVHFSYLFYCHNITNSWMISLQMCFSLIILPYGTEILLTIVCFLLSNKELIFRCLNRLTPFLCSAFSVDVVLLSFEIFGNAGLCFSQII